MSSPGGLGRGRVLRCWSGWSEHAALAALGLGGGFGDVA